MGGSRGVVVVVAGMVLAVGGCGGPADEAHRADGSAGKGTVSPTPVRSPSGELVTWVGGLCESTVALKNLRAQSAADVKEIRGADEGDLIARAGAIGYLSSTPSAVDDVRSGLDELGSSGVPAADRLLGALRKKVTGVATELEGMSPAMAVDDAAGSAEDVDELVQSLTPPKPDLPALAAKDPRLGAAYERAEQCAPGWKPAGRDTSSPAPAGPLPKAADGKNYRACADGACEVLVTSTADITADGTRVHVSVADDYVTFQSGGTLMQLGGAGGEAGFGDALKATVVAHDKDGAVLKFTLP
ncbi:hypothetical protein [Streptomyces africanus]|uniref:hypothetical protein n=1 Tax=Streptomyces africanus TaxID=231024 RepID=UPI000A3724EE|nr:hypothetical protein [Streptomyces africanus]